MSAIYRFQIMLSYPILRIIELDGGFMWLREYEMVMKSVADPTRVRILKALKLGGDVHLPDRRHPMELGRSTVSKHLFLLKMAGLVKERHGKKWVHYSLDGSEGVPYARKTLNTLKGWLNDNTR